MKIFISYSSKNRAAVQSLGADLEAMGHDVWFDQELSGGQAWWDEIIKGVVACDLFIFALTPESLASSPCRLEYTYANTLNKHILPVLLKDVDTSLLPPALSVLQFVDYRQIDRKASLALARALNGLPPVKSLPDPLPQPPTPPLSPLAKLGERVAAASLNYEEQAALLLDLKELLQSSDTAVSARQLLMQLQARNDLYAKISQELESALAAKPSRRRAAPSGAQPAAAGGGLSIPLRGLLATGAVVVLLILSGIAISQFGSRNTPAVPTNTQAVVVQATNTAAITSTPTQRPTQPPTRTPTTPPPTKTKTPVPTKTYTQVPTKTFTSTPSELPAANLVLWYVDTPDSMRIAGIEQLFNSWAKEHALGSTLKLVNIESADLVTRFQVSVASNNGIPDYIWTYQDQLPQLADTGTLLTVDAQIRPDLFLPEAIKAVSLDGKIYGFPLSAGSHLMLMYNKNLITTPPSRFDQFPAFAEEMGLGGQSQSQSKSYLLVYEMTSFYWVLPFVYGFGGNFFDTSGKMPSLNSEAWVSAYQLLYDLKKTGVVPDTCDYSCADTAFIDGKAAMIINGTWQLSAYKSSLGDKLGIADWPTLSNGQRARSPVSAKLLLLTNTSSKSNQDVALGFGSFLSTDRTTMLNLALPNSQLPALLDALNDSQIVNDPLLSKAAEILRESIVMSRQKEMSCVYEPLNSALKTVLSDNQNPADVADVAQKAALDCIAGQ